MDWRVAPDIKKKIKQIIASLSFSHLETKRIFCFRSFGSKSEAQARIWSLPRIWQKALKTSPAYCLEILSEKFDKLTENEQKKTLLHELLHIPQNFSGALLPHFRNKKETFEEKVRKLFKKL